MTANFLRIWGRPHHHLFGGRRRRGHDHHVRRGGQPHGGDWTLRAMGFPALGDSDRLPGRVPAARLCGRARGLFLASFLQFFTVSTTNFQTFAELAFSFD